MLYDDLENFCIDNHIDLAILNKNKAGSPNHTRLYNENGDFLFDIFFKHKKNKVLPNTVLIWNTGVYIKITSLNELSTLLVSYYNIKTNVVFFNSLF